MITLLAKKFIKDYKNYSDGKVRSAYGYLCAIAGIVLNVLLFAGKFLAGTLAGSVAVTADAFNNLSDAGSSVIGLIGFKLASQKPDPKHPFGHGRYEYLSSLIISGVIIIMGVELLKESIDKIVNPAPTQFSLLTFAILGASILVKVYMFLYNRGIGRKLDSSSMKATAMDSLSDSLATLAVLVSGIISYLTHIQIDGYVGLAVTGFIFYAGISSALDTVNELLGTPPDPEFVEQIEQIDLAHDGVKGIHDLIAHNYGPGNTYISLHAEVPADGDIVEIHDMIDNIEFELSEKLGCLATIHMDPIDTSEAVVAVKNQFAAKLAEIDEQILFHDFRMVSGETHTNLIFDVVVPHNYKVSDEELRKKIELKVKEINPAYFCVITVDKDYAGYIK